MSPSLHPDTQPVLSLLRATDPAAAAALEARLLTLAARELAERDARRRLALRLAMFVIGMALLTAGAWWLLPPR